jgi:hypothetical protein
METFWPSNAFSSVDLPTFGLPTIATKPDLKPGGVTKSVGSGTFMIDNE